MAGIDASLKAGADIIVNTDADNQYAGARDRAARRAAPRRATPTSSSAIATSAISRHMSWPKKSLQRLGSWVVRQVSSTNVPDTTSGFRAYTREAALRMTIVSEFSYTLESIIQAGKRRMAIAHVEVATNAAHAPIAVVRQRVGVPEALGRHDRAHLHDVRAAQSLHLHRVDRLPGRLRDLAAVPLLLFLRRLRARQDPVADPVGRADDRRVPGRAHRPARRCHVRHAQAARGCALPRANRWSSSGRTHPPSRSRMWSARGPDTKWPTRARCPSSSRR